MLAMDSVAVIVSAVCGLAATLVTQYYLARKDRTLLDLERKRIDDEHDFKLMQQQAETAARVSTLLTEIENMRHVPRTE